jgi:hypothetical protein
MPLRPFMFFARRPGTRLADSDWLIAIGVATVGLLIQRQPAHLTDSASCPGLLEWLVIAASRSGSRMPVATFLTWLNSVGVLLALLALTRWVQRAANVPAVTAAVSLAAAVTIVTTPALAPSDVLVIGAACAACLGNRPPRSFLLAVLAVIVPALALPLAAVAAWFAWRDTGATNRTWRLLAAGLAAFVVFVLALAQISIMPPVPGRESVVGAGCLVPRELGVQSIRVAIATAFEGTGPVPLAFALLGIFGLRHQIANRASWPRLALAILPVFWAAGESADPVRTLATTIAGFWWLVAVGVREIVAALSGRRAWQIGAWALVLLLPLLQWSHRSAIPIGSADEPRGHERLARRDFLQVLAALPARSTIVIDDAITEILLRSSAPAPQVIEKQFTVIPHDGRVAAHAATAGFVYAMPRAQFDLQHRGLIRVESARPGIPGIVAFERASECSAVDVAWQEAPVLVRSSHLALVADRPDARGPVVIYLGSSVPLNPHAFDWPAWSVRGYYVGTYDLRREADRVRLDLDSVEDRPPRDNRVFGYPSLTRLDLWRVPNGPTVLAVGLGHAPEAALARAMTTAETSGLRLCPSFPEEIERLEPRR